MKIDRCWTKPVACVTCATLFAMFLATGCSRSEADNPARTKEPASAAEAVPEEPVSVPDAWFENSTVQCNIDFIHRSGHQSQYYIPEIMSGGAALFDMDNDGDLDVYFVQSGSITSPREINDVNRLYRNRGEGTFDNVTQSSGAGDRGYGVGVTTGDYNNDGYVDLYVTNVGSNVLLRNNGDETFTNVSAEAGVDHEGFSTGAAFFDFDRDGDLDLYCVNYLYWSVEAELVCTNDLGQPDYCAPAAYKAPARDVLYRNKGDGTFEDVSQAAGIQAGTGTGLGIVCADFTQDGWPDVFIANDGMPDQLWVNQQDGRFVDEAKHAGCALDLDAQAKAGMGVTAEDIDRDGDTDVMVCNLSLESDSVFRNDGNLLFSDITALSGLAGASRTFTRFGMAWVDLDNDGWLDLYQANGRVSRQAMRFSEHSKDPFAEPNLLFAGSQSGRFEEVTPRGGTKDMLVATSRAAAFGDTNNDGGIDALVVNRDAPPYVLRNVVRDRGNWIMFRVLDEHGRDAIGARVTLAVGDQHQMREVRSAYSYCAANDLRVHFGLGEHTSIDSVTVTWIDGFQQVIPVPQINAIHTLSRNAGQTTP